MAKKHAPHLRVRKLGPIQEADIEFGDLTVIVGPQATGKSILLETLKLIVDRDHIHDTFARHNVSFPGNGQAADAFLGGFYGKGMAGLQTADTSIAFGGESQSLQTLAKRGRRGKDSAERVFYIPAQRVVSLPGGVSQNFSNFKYGDPYVLRHFSDTVHNLLQNEFGAKAELFPRVGRLNSTLRDPIAKHLYGGAKLEVDSREFTKSLVIRVPGFQEGLPFLAWSAGQREFTPLLLGLYWLCTAGKVQRRNLIEWVVIEEPEMGLHPQAISALLLLTLELMRRNYRVVISTHSPVVLDMVWALRQFNELGRRPADVRALFELRSGNDANALAKSALEKDYRVYFFDRERPVEDISALDPGAPSSAEAQWGGLVGFASRTADVIARAVNRQRSGASAPSDESTSAPSS